MSHITLAQQGLAAVEQRKWDEALPKLTKAIKESANPTWLLARSRALVGVGRFAEALDDADLAWHAAYERNKRPLMGDAHYRRAVAYLRLGRPADADCCCVYAMRLAKGLSAVDREDPRQALGLVDAEGRWTPTVADARAEAEDDVFNQSNRNNPGAVAEAMGSGGGADSSRHTEAVKQWRLASTMRLQALSRLEQLPADDPARKVTATQKPPKKTLNDLQLDDKKDAKLAAASSTTTATGDTATSSQQPAAPKPAVPSDTPLRLQEFQNDSTMSVSIFSKGNSKENLKVEFLPFQVRIDPIIYPSGEAKAFTLDLWGEIDTAASKHTVTPSKVELSLKKKTAGKWAQLKGEAKASGAEKPSVAETTQVIDEPKDKAAEKPATPAATAETQDKGKGKAVDSAPAYPTSSRSGPKNWDNIDGGDSDEESDVNIFFKKLYKNATPEQQRAMMKSFTESGGTSLSTDWNDVKARHVDAVPPEGLEAKKWGE